MIVIGKGHWGGDPAHACEELTVRVNNWAEAEQLAGLFRLLDNEASRARLFAEVERIDAKTTKPAAAAG